MASEYTSELIAKIYTEYAGDSDLSGAVTGGLWYAKAKQTQTPPYGVYTIISTVPQKWNAAEDPQIITVQFSYFVSGSSRDAIINIQKYHEVLFNNSGFTGTNYSFTFEKDMERGPFIEDESNLWRLDIDYQITSTAN